MKLEHVYRKDYIYYIKDINLNIEKPGIYGVFATSIGDVQVLFDVIARGFQDNGEVIDCHAAYVYSSNMFQYEHALGVCKLLEKTSFDGECMLRLCQQFDIKDNLIYRKLSSGKKHLFELSFNIAMNKDVHLFLDPFSHLDTTYVKLVKSRLIELYESGKVVLVSGQHLSELETILTDIVMIKDHTIGGLFKVDDLSKMIFNDSSEGAIGKIKRLNQTQYLHQTNIEQAGIDLMTFYEAYLEVEHE